MEAQAKDLHFDLANNLNKTADMSARYVRSTKTQMADIYTKALMGALSVGILGRAGLGALRSVSGKNDLNYGPDVGAQTLNIAARESDDEENFKTANARNWIASLIKHLPDVKVTPGKWDTASSPNIDHLYKGLTPLPAVKPAAPALTKKSTNLPMPFNTVRDAFFNPKTDTGLLSGDNYLTTPREGNVISRLFGMGDTALGAWGVPATYGAVPAALGALYGGYKLTDYILDKRRKATIDQELDAAQKSYDQAIAGQDKQAAAVIVDDMFDRMADIATTESADTVKQANAGQMLLGGYGLYGVLSALAAGVPSYKFFENRSKREMIAKALRQRQEKKFGQGIRPIYAYSDDADNKEDANPLSLEV